MVRETIISAATLAGLVGLACLYNTATSPIDLARSDRIARAAEDFAIDSDFVMDDANDDDFFADFDMSENDVMQFQDSDTPGDLRAGGAKKQISQVKNCLKNVKCTERAQDAVRKWASNSASYISANPARLLKPVATSIEEEMAEGFENDFGMCTPNDDSVPCNDEAGLMDHYKNHFNADPKNQYSTNADVQAQIESMADTSSSLIDGLESAASPTDSPRLKANAFSKRAAKLFLVIPNGVPVSMPESYNQRFGNYWRWFKQFNTRYIGAGIGGQRGANRVNMHFWFLRQDKNLKMVMKSPAKVSVRFPWKRFDSIMLPNQNTAAQPKIAPTLETLYSTISDKGFASDFTGGQDCFTLWFHHYIPQDILDLSDSLFQEEIMKPLEKSCSIIHVWVGTTALADDDKTARVVQYIQGLLQPEQLSSTSADPVRRRYYFVDSLETLGAEQGSNLMDQIYSDIAVERSRATCLLSASGNDLGLAFERANERYDEYYAYGDDSTTTMEGAYSVATSEAAVVDDYELAYEEATTTAFPESVTSTAEPLPNNWKCCGIGFAGQKFDANAQACCDDGSIADSEADCFLL